MTPPDFAQSLLAARSAGQEALQHLAEQQLPLVRMLARRFPAGCDMREELFQQGVIGLMKALQRYDPARGTAFSTYAAALILGEMRQLHRQNALLRLSRTELEMRRRIHHAEDTLRSRLQRDPSVTELAAALRMDAAELMLHMEAVTVASTDAENANGTPLVELIPDREDFQRQVELRDILARLPRMDQQLLLLRHRVGLSQTEAGKRLGMSQMQVSRREKVIRTLLQRALSD